MSQTTTTILDAGTVSTMSNKIAIDSLELFVFLHENKLACKKNHVGWGACA
jgi:hypothetical protein